MNKRLHDEKFKKRAENLALVAGIIQPFITVPQIIAIYGNKSADDVSLVTWIGYLVFGIVFLVYGLLFDLKPIWVGQIIWVTMQAIIVIGILLY